MNGSLTSFSLITAARLLQNKALFGDPGIQEANLHTLLKLVNGIMMREERTEVQKNGMDSFTAGFFISIIFQPKELSENYTAC